MSLYLGKKKVQVPQVTTKKTNKAPKAFFDNNGTFQQSTATTMEGWWDYEDTSGVTSCYQMFYWCPNLTSVPPVNISNSTSTSYMFSRCFAITEIPQLDLSKVTDASFMFNDCRVLTTIPALNFSNVKNLRYLFYYNYMLSSVPTIAVHNATNISGMFNNCQSIKSVTLKGYGLYTATAEYMFTQCIKLEEVVIQGVVKLGSAYSMFSYCSKLTSVPAFDVSNCGYASSMFERCSSLETIHCTGWKTNFDISASTKFTREALVEILNNLATITSTQTLTMGSTNLAKLTDDDKLIATNKGWTLA